MEGFSLYRLGGLFQNLFDFNRNTVRKNLPVTSAPLDKCFDIIDIMSIVTIVTVPLTVTVMSIPLRLRSAAPLSVNFGRAEKWQRDVMGRA